MSAAHIVQIGLVLLALAGVMALTAIYLHIDDESRRTPHARARTGVDGR